MKTTRIIATGAYLPKCQVSNDDLAKFIDTSDEWIASRTGIRSRHVVREEHCSDLAVEAAREALKNSGYQASDIDLIIVATCSTDYNFPNIACLVQKELNIGGIAFDVSAACSGYLVALHTAHTYIITGLAKRAIVIGAEALSRLVDWKDRTTCVLFGDGAGATVLEASNQGILALMQGANGAGGDCLISPNPNQLSGLYEKNNLPAYISMRGQDVFKFAVTKVPECIGELLKEREENLDDIKYFVLHQANSRILESVAKRIKQPIEKFPMNLDKVGNTSAASIPLLLNEMNRKGMLNRGDKIVLAGFGAGLTWGATLLTW
ncbi:MAG TPA: beta-ketoacyl-ACP synthase III [Lachnospiraceae bacterium]